MEEKMEIDLREIMTALLRRAWLIVLCAVIVGAAVFIYTVGFVTPVYRATVSFYVNNNNTGQSLMGITSSDLATSQQLVATYVNILKSNTVMDKVAEEAGLDVSASKLRTMISAEAMGETEIFQVHVSNTDPDLATKIANTVAEVAPSEIAKIVEGSSTKVIDYARMPTAPYTPSRMRNCVLGACVGAIIAVVVIILQVLLDVHIKNEEDLRQICDAPVLGVIPDFDAESMDGYEYASKASGKTGSKAVGK